MTFLQIMIDWLCWAILSTIALIFAAAIFLNCVFIALIDAQERFGFYIRDYLP